MIIPVAGEREEERAIYRRVDRRGGRRQVEEGEGERDGVRVCAREKQEFALFSVLMLPSITPTTFSRRVRARQSVHGFQWLSR